MTTTNKKLNEDWLDLRIGSLLFSYNEGQTTKDDFYKGIKNLIESAIKEATDAERERIKKKVENMNVAVGINAFVKNLIWELS